MNPSGSMALAGGAASGDQRVDGGRYQVFAELACGGMAMVYLGQLAGEHGFKRSIAIKQMHPQYARDAEFRDMFLDEARLVAKIRHPNVVPTLDIVSRDDVLLLVMEYVDGEAASNLIAEGPVPPRIAAAIVQDALAGLHAAHELSDADGRSLGVIHRDVSPANILVGTDGLSRILDFGVARAAGRAAPTRDGSIKGKVPYMPPEQLWGSELDRTVDVYAASVCLWEMLTGKRLFCGSNDADTMKRVIEEEVRPPSELDPAAATLDAVVMRGLSRDPSKRFPTAREMAKAIDVALTPASRLEIGEWVSVAARASLERRGELLRAMTRGEVVPAPQQIAAVATALMVMPNTVAGMSMTHMPAASQALASPLRRKLGLALGAVAVLAAVLLTIVARPLIERAKPGVTAVAAAAAHDTPPAGAMNVAPTSSSPSSPPVTPTDPGPAAAVATPAPPGGKSSHVGRGVAPVRNASASFPTGAPARVAAPPPVSPTAPPPGAVPVPVPGPALGSRY